LVLAGEPGATGDHVVHLVFGVRLLRICAPRGKDVEPGAEGRNTQELQIEFAAGRLSCPEIVELECLYRRHDGPPPLTSESVVRHERGYADLL
jgi:hypothetical protein